MISNALHWLVLDIYIVIGEEVVEDRICGWGGEAGLVKPRFGYGSVYPWIWRRRQNSVELDAKCSYDLRVASFVAVRVSIAQGVGSGGVSWKSPSPCSEGNGTELSLPGEILKPPPDDRLAYSKQFIPRCWCIFFLQGTVLKSHSNFGDEIVTLNSSRDLCGLYGGHNDFRATCLTTTVAAL